MLARRIPRERAHGVRRLRPLGIWRQQCVNDSSSLRPRRADYKNESFRWFSQCHGSLGSTPEVLFAFVFLAVRVISLFSRGICSMLTSNRTRARVDD
jgi:hypothetical protein